MYRSSKPIAWLAVGLAVTLAAGCTDDGDESGEGIVITGGEATPTDTTTDTDTTDDATTDTDTDTDIGTDSTDGTDDDDTTIDTEPPATDDDLPGEPFDIGPPAGSQVDVVGVRYGDVLNFRVSPDPRAAIVDTVAPLATSPAVVSSGGGRLFTRSAWWEVTVGGEEAWANAAFLGMLGRTDDVFDEIEAVLPSTEAPTVEELGEAIGETRASGPVPRVELVTPVEGLDAAGAEVTIDVIGLGDDALKGERLRLTLDLLFDDADAADPEIVGYRLVGAMQTLICWRGVSDGLCA